MIPRPLWRVFPWDPDAADGDPFSAAFVPPGPGQGRFDLQGGGVGYFAESEAHAVAEQIQFLRNTEGDLTLDDLTRWGRRLAIASATLDPAVWTRIPDLCDPATLSLHDLRPDQIAYRSRRETQRIAQDLHAGGEVGLRWWSAFWGEWHGVVLFHDRLPASALTYDEPTRLDLETPAVREAAHLLGIG